MQELDKKIKILFWFSVGFSVSVPVGIGLILLGALEWIVPALIIGILLTASGFYLTPLLWTRYAERRRDRVIVVMVTEDEIYDAGKLAAQMNCTERAMRERLGKLIERRELVGYTLNYDVLEPLDKPKEKPRKTETKKCEACGALMSFDGENYVCEYCGTVVAKK